jgi:UDP-3-O-acyl-N-acetylglucosamine deacetylase
MIYQQTINGEVKASGVGLHSGNYIDMKLMPAPPNTGICFRRVDIESKPTTKANIDAVSSTMLGTTLGESGFTVATVEHLLASLLGMGIDNLFIELNNDEVPIFDGSAASFVFFNTRSRYSTTEGAKKIFKN